MVLEGEYNEKSNVNQKSHKKQSWGPFAFYFTWATTSDPIQNFLLMTLMALTIIVMLIILSMIVMLIINDSDAHYLQ